MIRKSQKCVMLRLSSEIPIIVTLCLMNCTVFHYCLSLWTKCCFHYDIFIKALSWTLHVYVCAMHTCVGNPFLDAGTVYEVA